MAVGSHFNLEESLARVGGDEELLKEIVELFLADNDNMLSAVRRAVEAADAKAIERSAHTVKGCVANFGAREAFDAAFELERMGRSGQVGSAQQVCDRLSQALTELCAELERVVA